MFVSHEKDDALNRESERIPRSLTSTSSIRPEPFGSELKADLLMAEGSRVAAGIFNLKLAEFPMVDHSLQIGAGIFKGAKLRRNSGSRPWDVRGNHAGVRTN